MDNSDDDGGRPPPKKGAASFAMPQKRPPGLMHTTPQPGKKTKTFDSKAWGAGTISTLGTRQPSASPRASKNNAAQETDPFGGHPRTGSAFSQEPGFSNRRADSQMVPVQDSQRQGQPAAGSTERVSAPRSGPGPVDSTDLGISIVRYEGVIQIPIDLGGLPYMLQGLILSYFNSVWPDFDPVKDGVEKTFPKSPTESEKVIEYRLIANDITPLDNLKNIMEQNEQLAPYAVMSKPINRAFSKNKPSKDATVLTAELSETKASLNQAMLNNNRLAMVINLMVAEVVRLPGEHQSFFRACIDWILQNPRDFLNKLTSEERIKEVYAT